MSPNKGYVPDWAGKHPFPPEEKRPAKLLPTSIKKAEAVERALDYLDAPIKRVASLNVPIPYSTPLEKAAIPDERDIVKAVRELVL